ncbi:MAG TPA: DUF1501 domain-containing protein [Verrucomicrobiae bacterium]|nr:DUF1501 domain-containing protein [Verrucomicrobiae bacterium]
MKRDITLQTRREFLGRTILGGALSWTVPSFLANTFSALQADAADKLTQAATGVDSNILVVLQMAGGNDGINTVVPYSNDHYHQARPKLRLTGSSVLRINDDIGLNAQMSGFKELYDAGELSIVQGVGYPNPNRSHFRSTEIWQTAADSDKSESYGWLGRYFDNACSGCDPTVGVSVGHQMPLAFAAKTPTGVSLESPKTYRFIPGKGRAANPAAMEESFKKLNTTDPDMSDNAGDTVAALAGAVHHNGSALDFLERTALDAQVSSDTIRSVSDRIENKATYPASALGSSLKLVAKLIGGGLPTRVFYVSQGGYDTHTNQLATQNRVLKDLGDSVKAFVEDMKAQGNMGRVLVMTFSEFGRRVAENASGGTDHGAAAPMFVIGNKVKAGLAGKYPSLAPTELFQGDLKYTVDFRSVYAGILEGWLKTKSVPILGRQFPVMSLA